MAAQMAAQMAALAQPQRSVGYRAGGLMRLNVNP
jgi:hypothetical protein